MRRALLPPSAPPTNGAQGGPIRRPQLSRSLSPTTMRTPSHELARSAEALTVKVDLPEVKKASEVDLNISTTRLHLLVADT